MEIGQEGKGQPNYFPGRLPAGPAWVRNRTPPLSCHGPPKLKRPHLSLQVSQVWWDPTCGCSELSLGEDGERHRKPNNSSKQTSASQKAGWEAVGQAPEIWNSRTLGSRNSGTLLGVMLPRARLYLPRCMFGGWGESMPRDASENGKRGKQHGGGIIGVENHNQKPKMQHQSHLGIHPPGSLLAQPVTRPHLITDWPQSALEHRIDFPKPAKL